MNRIQENRKAHENLSNIIRHAKFEYNAKSIKKIITNIKL